MGDQLSVNIISRLPPNGTSHQTVTEDKSVSPNSLPLTDFHLNEIMYLIGDSVSEQSLL